MSVRSLIQVDIVTQGTANTKSCICWLYYHLSGQSKPPPPTPTLNGKSTLRRGWSRRAMIDVFTALCNFSRHIIRA